MTFIFGTLTFVYIVCMLILWRNPRFSYRARAAVTIAISIGAVALAAAFIAMRENPPSSATSPAAPLSFNQLDLTEFKIEGPTAEIRGKTDLPDGAIVSITVDTWQDNDQVSAIAVDQNTKVTDGKFFAFMRLPSELRQGPYKITLLWSPRAQSPDILAQVGNNGERLAGPLVNDHDLDFKTLERIEKRD